MDEMAGVRKRLHQALGQNLPDPIWERRFVQDAARDFLAAETEEDKLEEWRTLEEGAQERLDCWNGGVKEASQRIPSSTHGASRDMREAEVRDNREREQQSLDARELVSDRTKAMTGAMSALFALIGDQFPEVKEFREKILPGRFLAADEAYALIASRAARIFDLRLFEKWNIPVVGHDWDLVEHVTSSDRGGVYMRATVRVDPPGITRTVRYVDAYNSLIEEDVADTRSVAHSGAVIPLITGLPIDKRGRHTYPDWLWPGSVVDNLYDLSVELASAFDWPLASAGNLWGTRPRSESAAWFILTGEVPQVRPLEARWETKQGSIHLNPQWRIRLTIPPWLPEEEVLRAFRSLRRQRPAGHQLPSEDRTLEVARFVFERERVEGDRGRATWTKWWRQWNEKHPGHAFNTPNSFRMAFLRGYAAVTHLNFDWPNFEEPRDSSDTT